MRPRLPRRARRPEPTAAMRAAAIVLLLASAFLGAAGGAGLSATRIGAVDYVSLDDGADRLGLRVVPLASESAVILKDGVRPVARLLDRSREIDL